MQTSKCTGTSVPHYCSGASDVQCCVPTSGGGGSSTTYNKTTAISYANAYCDKDSQWECAEFVARALNAGGEFPGIVKIFLLLNNPTRIDIFIIILIVIYIGVTDYSNYKGYNLKYVSGLRSCLQSVGWLITSESNSYCGNAGEVLIYDINGDPDAHAALALGNCKLDQHNPSR